MARPGRLTVQPRGPSCSDPNFSFADLGARSQVAAAGEARGRLGFWRPGNLAADSGRPRSPVFQIPAVRMRDVGAGVRVVPASGGDGRLSEPTFSGIMASSHFSTAV